MLLRVRTLRTRTENVVLVLATSTSAQPVTVRVILCCGSDEFEDQYPRTSALEERKDEDYHHVQIWNGEKRGELEKWECFNCSYILGYPDAVLESQ